MGEIERRQIKTKLIHLMNQSRHMQWWAKENTWKKYKQFELSMNGMNLKIFIVEFCKLQ